MNHASLFSGIGGPEIAAAMLGWDNVFHCEINDFGRKILEYWFPKSQSYEDIKTTDFKQWRGKVDVLTGGFPCQPFSYAGQRRGADDDRYLWPQMLRAIDEIRPAWVVGENVAGIVSMVEQGEVSHLAGQATLFDEGDGVQRYRQEQTFTIERVCRDLEGLGYSVQPILVPACAVGAPHRRDRVFIIANVKDPMHGGQLHGQNGEQRSERNIGNSGAGSGERLRGETPRASSADTQNDGLQYSTVIRGEGGQDRAIQGKGNSAEWHISVEANGRRGFASDSDSERLLGGNCGNKKGHGKAKDGLIENVSGCFDDTFGRGWQTEQAGLGRWRHFPSVSPVHRGNDGLPFDVDDLAIPFSKWRTESLKAYGNAIVPHVMYEIFRAIQIVENQLNKC